MCKRGSARRSHLTAKTTGERGGCVKEVVPEEVTLQQIGMTRQRKALLVESIAKRTLLYNNNNYDDADHILPKTNTRVDPEKMLKERTVYHADLNACFTKRLVQHTLPV
uniref:Uncharacterized protein n=1 Tax=Lygus hesperus TaxID=30085 RepID=A0A146LWY7_LYGHE